MKKIFKAYLNPAGNSYSTRIKTYNNLAEADEKEIIHWLETNCSHKTIMELLAAYMMEEFHADEQRKPKIRITQEQFYEYFRVIKPHKSNEREDD